MSDVREVNIRVRMLCLIMLMSTTRLRRSLINRITRHVFLIVIRLRRIRRRLVIRRLIMSVSYTHLTLPTKRIV